MRAPRSLWRRRLRYGFWLAVTGFLVAAAWVTRLGTRWPSIYYMTGPSMEPTIGAGEYFVAWSPPTLVTGELVLFRFVDGDDAFHVLSRLAALPGDTVAMVNGAVMLNGRPQPWPFEVRHPVARTSPMTRSGDLLTWGPWIVPPDSVVVLADLRNMMGWPDSRFIGFVAQSDVLARATRTLRGRPLR